MIKKQANFTSLLFTLLTVSVWISIFMPSASMANSKQPSVPESDIDKSSEKLFNNALDYFDKGNYWDCARDLIILMDFNPQYPKIDHVVFTLAECLYEIDLPRGASKLYKHLITKYVRSTLLPRALLGLQRIEYDRSDFARCIEFHNAISRSNPPQSVLDASLYYAAMCFYYYKDYPQTTQLMLEISDKSPYYDYGQYTASLSYLRMKNVHKAISTFRAICTLPVTSEDRRHVIDESHLTLGYIYYELRYYNQAYLQFRAVSSDHKNYDCALLAAGWAASQQGNFAEAIEPLTTLVSLAPADEYAEEGFFLLGRCYLKMKKYDEALAVYDRLIEIFPERDVVPAIVREVRSSLSDEGVNIEKIKMDLLVLETKLLDVIPLEVDRKAPGHLREENDRLIETREGLLRRIQEERQLFDQLTAQVEALRQLAFNREDRRDWRAFAEYARSRAQFLKNMQ